MSAESIALITARASKMERGSGGVPEISEEDVCHALALIKVTGAALLMRVLIARQEMFRPHLVTELIRRESRGSSITTHVMQMCQMAVDEYCAPSLCQTCNGRESHKVGDLLIVCQTCNGTGKYRKPDHAGQIGCSEQEWDRLEPKYLDMLGRLSAWDAIGRSAISLIKKDDESTCY